MTGRSSKPRSCRSCRPRSCRPRAPRRHRPDSWCPRSLRTPLSSDCRPRSLTLRTSSHHPSAPKLTRRPRRRRSPMRRGSRRAHEERPRPVDHGPSEAGCNSSPSVGRKALPARERRQTVSDGAGDGGDPVVDTAAVNASIARGGAGRGARRGRAGAIGVEIMAMAAMAMISPPLPAAGAPAPPPAPRPPVGRHERCSWSRRMHAIAFGAKRIFHSSWRGKCQGHTCPFPIQARHWAVGRSGRQCGPVRRDRRRELSRSGRGARRAGRLETMLWQVANRSLGGCP